MYPARVHYISQCVTIVSSLTSYSHSSHTGHSSPIQSAIESDAIVGAEYDKTRHGEPPKPIPNPDDHEYSHLQKEEENKKKDKKKEKKTKEDKIEVSGIITTKYLVAA